ncbi:hypothetical protein RI129_012844 [Pyrocoelia pectoralis]|uniref:Uncharacterized protein n=1 Tax=Pyrocoelia pectoralis TaxID=417401 RepID=A0AAN7V742_9COLE
MSVKIKLLKTSTYQILHQAAGILKKQMQNFKSARKECPAPHDINQDEFLKQFDKSYKKNFCQFGLRLYVYHLVRSGQLLGLLYKIGISCTCNDIRQLTTNIGKQRINLTQFMYLPPGVQVVDNKIKNFDLNEDTIDGKNTTHCMGMVTEI